eukprot:scaffold196328_cov33-Tisochrysis_lutea.AAC.2
MSLSSHARSPPPFPSLPALRHLAFVLYLLLRGLGCGGGGAERDAPAPSGMVPAFLLGLWVACFCSGVSVVAVASSDPGFNTESQRRE